MALSEKDLANLQPGALLLVKCWGHDGFYRSLIFTLKDTHPPLIFFWGREDVSQVSYLTGQEFERHYFFSHREVTLIAPSFESVPLEDWASLAHLLHPKLKERVEKWLMSEI